MENKFKVKCLKDTDENDHIYDITTNNIYEVFSEFNLNNELQYLIVTDDIRIESIPAKLFTKDVSNNFVCPKCNCLNTKTSYYKSKLQERNMINKLAGTKEILDFCIYCGHSIE
jgi:hypothetical protein